MSSSLEERLKSNSSAFDGLLSLIPAKYYYDEDTQDQWKAKKKSKEESKQNKRAKLDPNAEINGQGSSASEVLKKRAKDAKPVVLPGQKKVQIPVEESNDSEEEEEVIEEEEKEEEAPEPKINGKVNGKANGKANKLQKKEIIKEQAEEEDDDNEEDESINVIFDDEGNEVDLNQQEPKQEVASSQKDLKSKSDTQSEEAKLKKKLAAQALREKLANKINLLKEKRKAPGTKAAGAPSSREAILEERRKKAELRAERKRKREELEKDESEESGESDEESEIENDESVIYQTIQFDENSRATSDLQNLRTKGKKKGPAKKDIKAHLKLLENKKQKLSQLDSSKQQELAEKDKWNRTIAQAEGQKIRDDERLLKKALKKKEAQKRKSEIQWKERKEHVENVISAKQKRREENLQIRKENKGIKRKNQQKQKRKFKANVGPKRAGFEGTKKSVKKRAA